MVGCSFVSFLFWNVSYFVFLQQIYGVVCNMNESMCNNRYNQNRG